MLIYQYLHINGLLLSLYILLLVVERDPFFVIHIVDPSILFWSLTLSINVDINGAMYAIDASVG